MGKLTAETIRSQAMLNDRNKETTAMVEPDHIKEFAIRREYFHRYLQTNDQLYLASAVFQGEKKPIIFYNHHHEIHKEIYNFINSQENKDFNLLIEIFVGGGKTSHICNIIAENLYKNDRFRVLVLTGGTELATQRKTVIQSYLETLYKITQKFIPYSDPNHNKNFKKSTSKNLRLHNAPHKEDSLECRSFIASSMGNRADLIVLDDVEQDNNPNSMQAEKEKFNKQIRDRKSGDSRIIVINTPYFTNGLVRMLEKSNTFKTLKLGLSTKLLDKDALEIVKRERIEKLENITLKNKILKLIEVDDIFKAAETLRENKFEQEAEALESTVDFRIYKEIIEYGEIIEQDILPQWDWLVRAKGKEILDKYINQRSAYMLTHALKPEEASEEGFFEHHKNALIISALYG